MELPKRRKTHLERNSSPRRDDSGFRSKHHRCRVLRSISYIRCWRHCRRVSLASLEILAPHSADRHHAHRGRAGAGGVVDQVERRNRGTRRFALSGLWWWGLMFTQGGGLSSLRLAWPCPGQLARVPSELKSGGACDGERLLQSSALLPPHAPHRHHADRVCAGAGSVGDAFLTKPSRRRASFWSASADKLSRTSRPCLWAAFAA